jgi:hypothetical protein
MKFRKRDKCYYLSMVSKKNEYEHIDWLIFYWGWHFDIGYEICGYFDNRPRINLDLIFFSLTLVLPYRNKWTDECDPPKYGLSIHNNTVWIYRGGKGNMGGGNKWWTWSIPFITKEWVRTSILLKDDTWEHETTGNRKDFWKDEWKQKQKQWTYNYTDSYDDEVIPTTIYVCEREWRPKWLKWTSLFSKKDRSIDIRFSKECGKRKGSWKGGTTGCGYTLLPNETPIQCLQRMEKERKF